MSSSQLLLSSLCALASLITFLIQVIHSDESSKKKNRVCYGHFHKFFFTQYRCNKENLKILTFFTLVSHIPKHCQSTAVPHVTETGKLLLPASETRSKYDLPISLPPQLRRCTRGTSVSCNRGRKTGCKLLNRDLSNLLPDYIHP